jgi:hypothetical protein
MTRSAFFLAIVVVAAVPATALGQHTAVVLDFEGRNAAAARRIVVDALGGQVEVIELRRAEEAARSQGVDLDSPGGLSQVAASEGVSMWIRGSVTGRRRRARTTVIILNSDGEEIARGDAGEPRGARGRNEITEATTTALATAIQALDAAAAEARAAEAAANRDELSNIDEELVEDEDEDEDEASEPGVFPLLEAMAGFGGRVRSTSINLMTAGRTATYDATFPEIVLHVASHPLARSGNALAGLFASFDIAFAIALSSQDEMGQEIPTSAIRLEGGVGYIAGPFGIFSIGPFVGIGYDSFSLDPNNVMASADYTYLRPALIADLAIADELLHLRADLGLRFAFGTGELAPFFGTSASAWAFDIGAALHGNLDMGLTYMGRLEIKRYGLSFEGTGTPAANTALDGGDLGVTFTAYVGYRLR